VQKATAAIKDRYPSLAVITDLCLCEYTDHGHCGVIEKGKILNDETLELLADVAISHARSGADMIAPSDMMDGRVAVIRAALDADSFTETAIMAYAVKYASAFYGPFRDAAGSSPQFGCRRSYQMDPANVREALREVVLDIKEAADIVMTKPALSYLDVTRAVREAVKLPVATYNVSGEYAMIMAADQNGWLDARDCATEALTAIRRAGADLILTYFAKRVAQWLQE